MAMRSARCITALLLSALPLLSFAMDMDNDGIADDRDECPQTRKGVVVGKNGCPVEVPASAPVVTPMAFADEDGDGVPDAQDQCPHSTKGLPVDEKGCVQRVRPERPVIKKGHASKKASAKKIVEPLPPLPESATPALTMSEPVVPQAIPVPIVPAVSAAPASPPVIPETASAPVPTLPPVAQTPSPVSAPVLSPPKTAEVVLPAPVAQPTIHAPTPASAVVAVAPPPVAVVVTAPQPVIVLFSAGRAELSRAAQRALDVVSGELLKRPTARLRIQATVAKSGDGAHSQVVAQERAEIVQTYLQAKGIDKARMELSLSKQASARNARIVTLELF